MDKTKNEIIFTMYQSAIGYWKYNKVTYREMENLDYTLLLNHRKYSIT